MVHKFLVLVIVRNTRDDGFGQDLEYSCQAVSRFLFPISLYSVPLHLFPRFLARFPPPLLSSPPRLLSAMLRLHLKSVFFLFLVFRSRCFLPASCTCQLFVCRSGNLSRFAVMCFRWLIFFPLTRKKIRLGHNKSNTRNNSFNCRKMLVD